VARVDYPAILEAAWAQHLAPRDDNAPTVISTFAGCGGSSLGYSMAGYRELLAVEWNDNAVETFKLNFPGVPIYHGDIHELTVGRCLELAGIEAGELDLFDGSPPCQGFSTAGKRKMDDKRNQLYMQFVRLLRGLQPKVFVMENVSGLVKGKMKLIFADIMRELKASGYKVRCKLLNAMYFNVPQSRRRLIFIGMREDLSGEVSFPRTQSKPMTVRDAFAECTDSDGMKLTERVQRATAFMDAGNYNHVHVMKAFERVGKSGGYQNNKLLSWDRHSCTLPKMVMSETGIIHPDRERYLSIGECMRLQSFPDYYLLNGSYRDRWARIGNSVPPLMMREIAQHIGSEILPPIRIESE
jgi:DNA (cytosine-5)-methyltransferase 1